MKTCIKFPDSIEDFCIACVPVGSRVTCNPPPTDTDQDILCLVDDEELEDFYQWIEKHNWEYEGDEKYQLAEFASYRKTCSLGEEVCEVNLIITAAPNWFDAFMDATRECKEKNVLTKAGRIEVFEKYIPQKKNKSSILKKVQATMASQGGWWSSPQIANNYNSQASLWGTTPTALYVDDIVEPLPTTYQVGNEML